MDCVPNGVIDALIPWVYFVGIGATSALIADMFTMREARRTGMKLSPDTPLLRLQTYNVSLVIYFLSIFCAMSLMLVLLVNFTVQWFYLCVDALFRVGCGENVYFKNNFYIQWVLMRIDQYVGPRKFLSFVGMRMWSAHALVLVAVVCMGVVHTGLFAEMGMRQDPVTKKWEVGANTMPLMFRFTMGTVYAVLVAAYFVIFFRDMVLVVNKDEI